MERLSINPLIREKLHQCVADPAVRAFVEDVLGIEQGHRAKRGKIEEYEKALAKYVRTG